MGATAGQRWIVVRQWEKFQHPDVVRGEGPPKWIKDYIGQLDKDEYMDLAPATRALLHGLRLMYARRRRHVRLDTSWLSRQLNMRVTNQQIDSLVQAGFIMVVASNPASNPASAVASLDKEEKRPPLTPPRGNGQITISKKDLRRYTGCRWVRGSHGATHIFDPLGLDKPPPDWPYERPTEEQVKEALAK